MTHILIVSHLDLKPNNFISIYDNALTSEECKSLIDYFESNDEYWSLKQDGMMSKDNIVKEWKDSQDRTMSFFRDGYFQDNLVNQTILKSINFFIENFYCFHRMVI